MLLNFLSTIFAIFFQKSLHFSLLLSTSSLSSNIPTKNKYGKSRENFSPFPLSTFFLSWAKFDLTFLGYVRLSSWETLLLLSSTSSSTQRREKLHHHHHWRYHNESSWETIYQNLPSFLELMWSFYGSIWGEVWLQKCTLSLVGLVQTLVIPFFVIYCWWCGKLSASENVMWRWLDTHSNFRFTEEKIWQVDLRRLLRLSAHESDKYPEWGGECEIEFGWEGIMMTCGAFSLPSSPAAVSLTIIVSGNIVNLVETRAASR